jgi:hypothetical protein
VLETVDCAAGGANRIHIYPRQPATTKIMPGARLGMVEAMAGDVIFMPCSISAWNPVTLELTSNKDQ